MDKNTTIGLVLIFAVMMAFSYFNRPSQEEIEAAKHRRDSIEMVQRESLAMAEMARIEAENAANNAYTESDTLSIDDKTNEMINLWGDLGVSAIGKEKLITLENNLMKVEISTKGGQIHSVELKSYKRFDSTALKLIEDGKAKHCLTFFAQNRNISTDNFYFTPSDSSETIIVGGPEVAKEHEGRIKYNKENQGDSVSLSLKLNAGDGRYIEYVYTLKHNSYDLGFDINTSGMQPIINSNAGYLNFDFGFDMPRQENRSSYGEDRYASIYYKYNDDEVDHLSNGKSDKEDLNTPVKWIGFKQLFFSTILIADNAFPNAAIVNDKKDEKDEYLASMKTEIGLPYDNRADNHFGMKFYFGPNHYQTLHEYELDMEKLIDLGWPIVREFNRYFIIPIFNFLRKYISNFGIIILLLTILIRIIVFYPTYKTNVSQAKMRVLKPEMDEINKKYPPEKAMERQQATMDLYKKAGVNPMGGCLPMLLQMPILVAMFYFFPCSIELRQEGFLWATDLSTYDSILNLPFNIPMYGDHVSLFTLLMTISTLIQTKISSSSQDTSAMPGMKAMMYIMPIFFLFILNSYSSGLSYYYLLSNIIGIAQLYIVKGIISEDKVRAQILINKKKPSVKKKSGFQARMDAMIKEQQRLQQQNNKRR